MIVTRRLTLVPPSDESIPKMVEWLNDPDVTRYSEQRHQKHTVPFQRIYIGMMTRPHKYLEIRTNDTIIGTITAHVDPYNDVADVGIMIGEKSLWGKGYGAEAWQAFCDYLLGNGIRKVECGCMNINFGMKHICRKTGMNYEGRRFAHFLVGEDTVDMLYFGRFR
jgi:RimJ/RimL family protein N-acetyltransferase